MVESKKLLGTNIECVLSNKSLGLESGKFYLVESLSWGIGVKTKTILGDNEIDLDESKNQKYFKLR